MSTGSPVHLKVPVGLATGVVDVSCKINVENVQDFRSSECTSGRERDRERETDRQKGKQTDRQRLRLRDRDRDTDKQTENVSLT